MSLIRCSAPTLFGDADAWLENLKIRLRSTTEGYYGAFGAGDLFGVCEGWEPPGSLTTHPEAGHVYTNCDTDIPTSQPEFGYSRSKINIDLWQDAPSDSTSFMRGRRIGLS